MCLEIAFKETGKGLAIWLMVAPRRLSPARIARVGGTFRIRMKSKDRSHEHSGAYQIVDPPAKLAFTWSGLENPGEVTLVTVEFIARGGESDLILTHERFSQADVAQRYETGWTTIAGKFAEHLEQEPGQKPAQRPA
jgi:uncharacterized protein YndB with AHSA1/START domain